MQRSAVRFVVIVFLSAGVAGGAVPPGLPLVPESCPGFQQQPGKVAVLGEMINWCIRNPLECEPLALDDANMVALQA